MATSPVTIDPSDVQPHIDASDVQVDNTPAPAATPQPAQEPGFGDILSTAWERMKGAYNGTTPLTDAGNATLSGVGSIARGTTKAVKGMAELIKPPSWEELEQAMKDAPTNPATAILTRRMGAGVQQTGGQAAQVPAAIKDINASPDPTGTYLKAAQETAGEGAGQAITAIAGDTALRNLPEGSTGSSEPGIVKQVIKGKSVAQPGAASAVRSGVQSSTEAAGTTTPQLAKGIQEGSVASPTEGNSTILDEPLKALKDKESAAYKKVDDTAGFDVKAEKAQLANDQYKLKQLGNTPEDVAARQKLIRSIDDSQARISQAEGKLQEAGIDPKAADTLHKQRMAGNDFKKILTKNTQADGSLNVDGLLRDSKSLRFAKNGDRLSQFMGENGANQYMTRLSQMQKLGAHAVKAQQVAKWVAGVAGAGAAAEGASKVLGN